MSLVENLARRHPGSLELMREIGALKDRGYTNAEIAAKIDFTPDYIAAICYLLEHGEERLLAAVERGVMPANIAMEIARAPDGDIQQALAEAYENKLLPGNQILAIRRIILQRNQRRKKPHRGRGVTAHRKGYRGVADQELRERSATQTLLVRKADLAQTRLSFVVNALRRLLTMTSSSPYCAPKRCTRCRDPWPSSSNCRKPECPIPSKWRLSARSSVCHSRTFCRCGACPTASNKRHATSASSPRSAKSGLSSRWSSPGARKTGDLSCWLTAICDMPLCSDLGSSEAPCLIADDDEAFTYNKRVNRLATIQEHYMIVKAIERGVSEEKLARALNVDIKRIKTKRTLLDGVCPEVAEMLKDKSVDTDVFTLLRKMKPLRQIEAVELMSAMNNFTARYAHALLAATRREDLAPTGSPEEDPRSDGRADGPHGARDGRAAARVQSGLGVLWGYRAQPGGRLGLYFEPDRKSPGERLSRTPPPGNPDRIQSHCRSDVVGGKRLRRIGRARSLGLRRHDQRRHRGCPARCNNVSEPALLVQHLDRVGAP